jgi:hypothetical protein
MSGGCGCAGYWPICVPDLSGVAELAAKWERLRRELSDPYSPLLERRRAAPPSSGGK